jgi:hypothetical protein
LPEGLADRPLLPALIDGEADSCLPLCATGILEPNRVLQAGSRYQTLWFFGGYMTLTPPTPTTLLEDSTGGLEIGISDDPEYHTGFALDPYPVKDGERVAGIANTVVGFIAWLRGNENYEVSSDIDARIGGLPATAVDIRLSPTAPEQYDDCGAPCVDLMGFEQWFGVDGVLGDDVYRMYFADVEYNGTKHLFVVEVESRDRPHLESLLPAVEGLLASVTLPAHAPRE